MYKTKIVFFLIFLFILSFYSTSLPLSTTILRQTEQCFLDGQIPCIFLSDINNGFAYPFFLNQTPMPYYFALNFRLIGFNYSLSLIVSSVIVLLASIYLFRKTFFQKNSYQSIFISILISLIFFYFSNLNLLLGFCLLILLNTSKPYLSALTIGFIIIASSKPILIPIVIFIILAMIFLFKNKTSQLWLYTFFGIILSSFYLVPAFFNKIPSLPADILKNDNTLKPVLITGNADISEYRKRSNFWRFTVNTIGDQNSLISIPVVFYDGWTYFIDQVEPIPYNPEQLKPVYLSIPPGKHTVTAFFKGNRLNFISNTLSLISLISIFVITFPKHVDKFS